MARPNVTTPVLIAAAIGVIALLGTVFYVDETEHVIITQFGEYKRTISEPGLNFKVPFTQEITRIQKPILASDASPEEYFTEDKKRIVADPITRWRVADPLKFYTSMGDVSSDAQRLRAASTRLDDIVGGELRQELGLRTMGDMVGSARQGMMANVTERTRTKAREFGIEVVDVQIKHLDLPKEVQQSVFGRMVAERSRLAKGYRAQGQEESDKITSQTDKEEKIIIAEAKKTAEEMRGEGDALSTTIYADAYGADPEFYAFVRNLEAYEQSLNKDATMVMSTGSPLFRYLTKPGTAPPAPPGAPAQP